MIPTLLLNIYHGFSVIIVATTSMTFPFMCYLFLYKSKPEMSTFRWYLLVNACWVYLYTLILASLQPVPVLSNFGIIVTGISKSMPLGIVFTLMELGYFVLTAQVYSTQVLFFYRYSLMLNNCFIRKCLQTKFAILFNIFSTLFFGLSMTLPSTLTRIDLKSMSFNESEKMNKSLLWFLATQKDVTVLTYNNVGSSTIFIFNVIGIIFAFYAMATIIYCAGKIRSDYLHIKGPSFCPKTRKLRRIFLYTLAVNLFAVLISLILPIICCFFIPIILQMPYCDEIVVIGLIWSMTHPIINFSLTIAYVSPYREAVKQIYENAETKVLLIFYGRGLDRVGETRQRISSTISSKVASIPQNSWIDRRERRSNVVN